MRRVSQSLRRYSLGNGHLTAHGGRGAVQLLVSVSLAQGRAAMSTSPPNLTQQPTTSTQHASTLLPSDVHEAFFALLRQRLCSPTRPLPVRNVYDELTNRSRVVEEFHFAKSGKRLARQRLALSFLRRYNVLLHSLLFFSENSQTWNTTPEFQRLALFGESILSLEVRGRLLKLFPDVPYHVLVQTLRSVVGEDGLNRAFDRYDMKAIVGAKPQDGRRHSALTVEQKTHMFCAVIGEMYWFVARTRPTDRTHNNAIFPPSDVLILHVLCSHLLECIPAELIYRVLEPVIADVKRVWVNAPMSVPAQLRLVPRTIGALSLNAVPLPHLPDSARPRQQKQQHEAQSVRRALTRAPETKFAKSLMRPMCNHRNFDGPHYQELETDETMERCALSATREQPPKDTGSAANNEEARAARAMQLAKLALQNA